MIREDISDFTVNVEQWVAKSRGRMRSFALEFIQDINQAVVEATPVKTGFLRGSWWATLGAGGEPGPPDPSGSVSVSRMNLVAASLKLGDVYSAHNGAAYAARLEFGFEGKDSLGRQYHQAPRAFVRGTLDRAEEFAADAAARVAALP